MKYVLQTLYLLLVMNCCFGQNRKSKVCFYGLDNSTLDWACLDRAEIKEDSIAKVTIQDLLKPLALKAKFTLRQCSEIQNFASFKESNQKFIVYNQSLIDSIADPANRKWDKLAAFLHELAHHLNDDIEDTSAQNSLQDELNADEFAGTHLARLGANLSQAQHALTIILNPPCNQDADASHPCLEKRLVAVAQGWYYHKGIDFERFLHAFTGKKHFGRVTDRDLDQTPDNNLDTSSFFEHNICLRKLEICDCHISTKALSIEIDLKNRTSNLTVELIDNGKCKICKHPRIDTTITFPGRFFDLSFLPNSGIHIGFDMEDYLHGLDFRGQLLTSGEISGELISENFHGVSFRKVIQKPSQLVAKMTMTPK
jgi:hypothetical protein